jgi:hypothetical protein
MDISAELDRIFPVPLPEADLTKASDELFKFLSGLSKEEFETAITLLPDKPKLEFEDKEQTHGQYLMPDYHVTTVKTVFWDAIVQYTIIAYIGYVSATDIISHLLKRKKAKPGTGLRSLANKVSPRLRFQLFEHLLSLEDKDARSRPFTEGEFEDYIENQFGGGRIGMVEYALEELLDTYKNLSKKNKTRSTITGRLEHHILARIQQRRRGEFSSRLGKIDSVNKARFAAEEVKRELYVYRTFDPIYVSELSAKIYTQACCTIRSFLRSFFALPV